MVNRISEADFERPTDIWTYRARPDQDSTHELGVVDGDTYELVVDLGFRTMAGIRVRAMHINTAETHGVSRESDEYQIGIQQTQFVREWIDDTIEYAQSAEDVPREWPLLIRTERQTGKYGRWLAELFDWRGKSLETAIINEFGDDYISDG
ncbi:hypothetical protein [Natronococcus wangiae]|uniref:hypothetical protein n=1 Tax=Natronococcus wangiae TaxID=3068275 RepID=UPI00273DBCAE|nr:hypothetical protein [Natronococcus sp. AD5]